MKFLLERQHVVAVEAEKIGFTSGWEKFKTFFGKWPKSFALGLTSAAIVGLTVSGTLPTLATIIAVATSTGVTTGLKEWARRRGQNLPWYYALPVGVLAGIGAGTVFENLWNSAVEPLMANLPIGHGTGLEIPAADPPASLDAGTDAVAGFDAGTTVQNDWEGFEKLTELAGQTPDKFTTDLLEDYLEGHPELWEQFFGHGIPEGATYETLTRAMAEGTVLNYGVLTEHMGEIIERAEGLGYDGAVDKLIEIQNVLTGNIDTDFTLRIGN